MDGNAASTRASTTRLVSYPALLTLVVTLARLAGELISGSKTFFNTEQGGAWAIVGIVWLVPVFGAYFGFRLVREGDRPSSLARGFGICVLSAVVFVAGFLLYQKVLQTFTGIVLMWCMAALAGALQILAWPRMFRVLAAYAYAARVPVAVVMLAATLMNWPSHYNANVQGFTPLAGFFLFGFIPQLIWWVSFTIVLGTITGLVTAAVTRGKTEAPATAA